MCMCEHMCEHSCSTSGAHHVREQRGDKAGSQEGDPGCLSVRWAQITASPWQASLFQSGEPCGMHICKTGPEHTTVQHKLWWFLFLGGNWLLAKRDSTWD